ncbi:unnamed protein product [Phyllotreta striolata]|uniref:Glutathione S-transferase n=1 Tax=Phyllotreta striolata TaxID=444603 RepID=A0A9N9XS75_PHYSR|nr:unnamed protein product [Phyllotreta striolata]
MAPIDFYYVPGSAPCRNVLLTAKALGVELNLKLTDLMKGEHLSPEYIKLNPQHTVPTIDDNGFVLWESRAIMTYLANQYANNDTLYPKDPKKRAVVDQRLYFDMGTLYKSFGDYFYPMAFANAPADPEKLKAVQAALAFLDGFIGNNEYVAGDSLTLADLAIVSSVSTIELAKIDLSAHGNVVRWFSKVKATAPGYVEANEKPLQDFRKFVDKLKL